MNILHFWSESAVTYIFLQMDIHTFWIWISFITAWTLEAFKFSFWVFKALYQMCWYSRIQFLTVRESFIIPQFVYSSSSQIWSNLHKLFWNNPGFRMWKHIFHSWISCIFWSESAMSSSAITYVFLQMDIQIFWIKISFITAWTLEAFKFSFWVVKAPYQMCWYSRIQFLTVRASFTIPQYVYSSSSQIWSNLHKLFWNNPGFRRWKLLFQI